MTYSSRPTGRAPDGSPTFATDADRASEEEVAAILERAWGCELRRFTPLPGSWSVVRRGQLVGIVQITVVRHPAGRWRTVLLDARRWLAAILVQAGWGVPVVLAVKWADDLREIRADQLSPWWHRAASANVLRASGVEPVIEVDVAKMRRVG